ncbi:MAG: CRISPR-associated helicase Cas3' [Chloroflexi bacterium]|nr:CRISPR-associated helicase Cas3' [Chloroflexota bacterium]
MRSFEPYPFQRRVADLLLQGSNVILQAPTGAGKTWAAKLSFVEARDRGVPFPHKAIYAVPMRVLANQFVEDHRDLRFDDDRDLPFAAGILTGERPEDREFRKDIVFATIDQVLSSFLLSPYSLSRRQGNLNAGAVASSYLVLDEFHLFDPFSTLPTTLAMLRMLRGVVPFLLMTATFSRDMLDGLAGVLDAVVVPETEEDARAMQALACQQKTRRYHTCQVPLTGQAVIASPARRSLVICNVVERAQQLYQALCEHPNRGDTNILLLHSRFLPEDRRRIEDTIRQVYARGATTPGRWITVATQAIEVGLDITCEMMHTELAPANAILQRAGRCARYQGETGDVLVYRRHGLDTRGEPVDLAKSVMPYAEMEQEARATWDALSARDGQPLSFAEEQELVSQVHGARDRQTVVGFQAGQEAHRRLMEALWRGEHTVAADRLIHQISSKPIVIHNDPDAVAEAPFAYEAFGLHTGSAYGLLKEWLEREEGDVYALADMGGGDESESVHYDYVPVKGQQDARGAILLIVDSRLATYDPDIGFLPRQGGNYISARVKRADAPQRTLYGYRLEPYADHARLTLKATRRLWPEVAYAARRLEDKHGWPPDTLCHLAEAIALLHDTGKLNADWQRWVRAYQSAIGHPVKSGYYAHTDHDPLQSAHLTAGRAQGVRPSHAAEGALAAVPTLAALAHGQEVLLRAAFSAIARHHGAFTASYRAYSLDTGFRREVAALLRDLEIAPAPEFIHAASPEADSVDELWVNPQRDEELLAYMLFARILLLADHTATAEGSSWSAESHQKEDPM